MIRKEKGRQRHGSGRDLQPGNEGEMPYIRFISGSVLTGRGEAAFIRANMPLGALEPADATDTASPGT